MNKKESFEARIEKIVKSRLISKKSTKELIEYTSLSPGLNSYFNQLSRRPKHKRFLFLHRFDIFGLEDEIQIPYLHPYNLPKKKKGIEVQESKALQYVVSNELEVVDKGKNILNTMFGVDEDKWDTLSEDLKDVVAYFVILFIRSNPKIKKLVNAKQFNYVKMKKVLHDYQDTIDFDALSEEIQLAFESGGGKIDPIIKSKMENLFLQLISGIIKNTEGFIENVPKIMPNFILSFHLSAIYWLENILAKSDLSLKDYIDILDELHRNHLIENKSMIFWCENCSLESPSHSQRQGRIAPSKTCRSKCLNCSKLQSHASIYSLDPTLKESIFSKDGLLPIYFGWLLNKKGIDFDVGVFSDKYENDFIVGEDTIVECKMFKSEKDKIAIRSEMVNCFSQLKKHIKQLESEGMKIKKAYLLWNRTNPEVELQKKLKAKYKKLFDEYELQVICPDDIEIIINELITEP